MQPFVGTSDDVRAGSDSFQTPHVAALAFDSVGINRNVTNFSREAGCASPQLSVENDCAADSITDRHIKHVAAAAASTHNVLTVSRSVRIVLNFYPQARCIHEFRVQFVTHG